MSCRYSLNLLDINDLAEDARAQLFAQPAFQHQINRAAQHLFQVQLGAHIPGKEGGLAQRHQDVDIAAGVGSAAAVRTEQPDALNSLLLRASSTLRYGSTVLSPICVSVPPSWIGSGKPWIVLARTPVACTRGLNGVGPSASG